MVLWTAEPNVRTRTMREAAEKATEDAKNAGKLAGLVGLDTGSEADSAALIDIGTRDFQVAATDADWLVL
jgi:hypothetical protein